MGADSSSVLRARTAAQRVQRCLLAVMVSFSCACSSIPPGRSAVDEVALEGSRQLDDDDVLERIATQPSSRFLGLFPGVVYSYSIFDPTQLEKDRKRIRRFYQARGYYHARVDTAQLVGEGTDHVEVTFRVHEGPPTNVSKVTLDGLDELPPKLADELRSTAKLPIGKPFEEAPFVKAANDVKRRLTDAGYAHAKVTRDAFVDIQTYRAEVSYRVAPGPKSIYGAISIEGLGELSEQQLRNALDLRAGQDYSSADIAKAEQNAMQLGVFNAISIVPQLRSGIGIVPLLVKVVPAKLRSIRIGGGLRLDALKSDVHALAVWQDNNFLGDMRSLTLDAQLGVVLYPLRTNNFVLPDYPLVEGSVRGKLLQRGVIEARTEGTVEASAAVYPVLLDAKADASSDTILGYAEIGSSAGLRRTFGRLTVGLRQRLKVEIPFAYRGELDDDLSILLISYPELNLTWDLRNSRIHPTSGAYFNNVLQVGAFGSAQDVRIRPEARGYLPIYRDRISIAAKMSVGFLFPLNYGDTIQALLDELRTTLTPAEIRDLQLMFFRGFFSGGPNSNRGYPQSAISPHTFVPYLRASQSGLTADPDCDPNNPNFDVSKCSSPIGGRSLWEAALEIRFRVFGPFLAAAFCDASDVAPKNLQLRFNHPHLSCGGGIRYDTAIGPLRLDVGYRIPGAQFPDSVDPRVEGDPGTLAGAPIAISFGIGQAF